MMNRTIALALSLTIAGAPAIAAPLFDGKSSEIRIDDLDLTSAQGRQRLDTRIKSAARSLCNTGVGGLAGRAQQSECMADVLAATQPQSDRAIARAQGEQAGTQLALLMVQNVR